MFILDYLEIGDEVPHSRNHRVCLKCLVQFHILKRLKVIRPALQRFLKIMILDNAVVGYCLTHGLKSSNRKYVQQRKAKVAMLTKRAKELGIYDEIMAEAKRHAEGS